jgi:hypothetical protein
MNKVHNVAINRSELVFASLVFAVFACASRVVDDARLQTTVGKHNEDGGMGMVFYQQSVAVVLNQVKGLIFHAELSHSKG